MTFRSAFVVRMFCFSIKDIVLLCLSIEPNRVVNIDSVIVHGSELSWTYCCECRFDYRLLMSGLYSGI